MASRGRGGFRDRGDLNRRGIQKNLEGPAATFMPDRTFYRSSFFPAFSQHLSREHSWSPVTILLICDLFNADIRNLFRPRDELIWTAPVKPPSMGDSGSALSGTAEFTRWVR